MLACSEGLSSVCDFELGNEPWASEVMNMLIGILCEVISVVSHVPSQDFCHMVLHVSAMFFKCAALKLG